MKRSADTSPGMLQHHALRLYTLSVLMLAAEVFLRSLGIRLHRRTPGGPVCRADLPVLVCELERVDQPQGLLYTAAHRQIVDLHHADVALTVNDEQAPQRDPCTIDQHTIVLRDLLVQVRDQRDLHVAQSSLRPGSVDPSQMGELGVHRHGNELTVDLRHGAGTWGGADGDGHGHTHGHTPGHAYGHGQGNILATGREVGMRMGARGGRFS